MRSRESSPAVTARTLIFIFATCCQLPVMQSVGVGSLMSCPNTIGQASQLMKEVKTQCTWKTGVPTPITNGTDNHRGACMDDCMISEDQATAILQTCRVGNGPLPAVLIDKSQGGRVARKRRSIYNFDALPNFRWPLPILYDIQPNFTSIQQTAIRKALGYWAEKTCVTFREVSASEDVQDKPHVVFKPGDGCISFVGKVEKQPQPLYLHGTCFKYLTVTHEVGHLLGMWHTHQQPGRDGHVKVWKDRIVPGEEGSFMVLPASLIRTVAEIGYDYASIMHYDRTDLSDAALGSPTVIETLDPLRQGTIGQRVQLSFMDTKTINTAYCTDVCAGLPLTSPCRNGGYQDPRDCGSCICPDGWDGKFCASLSLSKGDTCGGELLATSLKQVIKSPRYDVNNPYPKFQHCTWRIKTTTGRPVKLRFTGNFGLHCTPFAHTCHDWVELRFRAVDAILGPRFCCEKPPTETFTAETSETLVLLRSHSTDSTTQHRVGFTLEYVVDSNRCDSSPCQNGGLCRESGTIVCECLQGFSGNFCQIRPEIDDPCIPNPCENKGICLPTTRLPRRTYICICLGDYYGQRCEIAPDPCITLRCVHGTCVSQNNTAVCVCDPGYTSPRCNIDVNECSSNPCKNGGQCLNGRNGFRCFCQPKFTGILCEMDIPDGCKSTPCQNGQCVSMSQGSYRCTCTDGWSGRNCDVFTGMGCRAGYCQAGGTCLIMAGVPRCLCTNGRAGGRCERVVNECGTNPCPAGRCVPLSPGAYMCVDCPPGIKCNNGGADNACTSSPCANGGRCVVQTGTGAFSCICPQGFSGPTCSNVTMCAAEICKNGGTCVQVGTTAYRCICRPGLSGKNCELGWCGACGAVSGSVHEPCVTLSTAMGYCTRTVHTHVTSFLFFFSRRTRRRHTVHYPCQKEVKLWDTAFCCDNAQLLSDSNTGEKKCVVPGWEPFGPCSGECGGCGSSRRRYLGLTENGAFSFGMTQSRPCNTAICRSCSWAGRIACRCASRCCAGFHQVGQQCVSNRISTGYRRSSGY